jgi:hypothetical protein
MVQAFLHQELEVHDGRNLKILMDKTEILQYEFTFISQGTCVVALTPTSLVFKPFQVFSKSLFLTAVQTFPLKFILFFYIIIGCNTKVSTVPKV